MNILLRLMLITVAVLGGTTTTYADAKTDEWKKALVGKWLVHDKQEKAEYQGTTIFKADGTFTGAGTIKANSRTIDISVKGTWEIKEDKLIEVVTECNIPQYPVPKTTTDTIHSIDAKEFKYKSGESGREITETRAKD